MSPSKPMRPCSKPGCPNLTQGRYCEQHAKQEVRRYDEQRGTSASRGYDARWKKFRKAVLTESPLCHDCQQRGLVKPAVEVHHIKKLRDGGNRLSRDNVLPLCKECHSRRTIKGE